MTLTERTWGLKERALRSGEIRRVGKEERMKKSALILMFLACVICIGLTACSGQLEETGAPAAGGTLTVYSYYFTDSYPGRAAVSGLRREIETLFYQTAPEDVKLIYYDPTGGDTTMDCI